MTIPPRDLVFATGKGRVAAINPIDGTELWRATVKQSAWNVSSIIAVCVVDGIVVVSCGPWVTGLDGETGSELWTTKLRDLGSQVLISSAGEPGPSPAVRQQITTQQAAAASAASAGG